MASRLREVFRTYTTRWEWWLIAGIWLLLILVGGAAAPMKSLGPVVILFPAANVMLGMLFAIQLKLQFADPRARLLPGFAAVHLLAAGAIVAAAVLLEAVAVASSGAVSGVAVAGLALALIAATAWCTYRNSISSFLLIVGIPAAAMAIAPRYITGPMEAAVWGNNPALSLATVCIAMAALAALGMQLWTVCEDMPEYSRRIPASIGDVTSRAALRERRKAEAQVIARSRIGNWWRDTQFRLVFRWLPARDPLRGVLLRQLGGGFSALFVAQYQFGIVLIVFAIQGWSPQPFDEAGLAQCSFFPFYLTMSVLSALWVQRQPCLARESLYPRSRMVFVHDFARSIACDVAAIAAGHCGGILVGLRLFGDHGPLAGIDLPYLAMTVVQYVVGFGAIFWLVSFRGYWAILFGLPLVSITSSVLVVVGAFAGDWLWSLWGVAIGAGVTAAAVVGFYRLAFRRWCRVEFD